MAGGSSSTAWGFLRNPLVALVLVCPMGTWAAAGQTDQEPSVNPAQQSPAAKAADALDRIKRDDVGTDVIDGSSYIQQAAGAGPTKAIPVLEAFFARHPDPEFQAEVAWILVWLGDKDDRYWKLVLDQATTVVESEVPSPFKLDLTAPKGKEIQPSSELDRWAKAHGLTIEAAYRAASIDLPRRFTPFARTGDPRGIPLLRRALNSPNFVIRDTAAAGLAEAHDEACVPLIVDLVNQLPIALQGGLVSSLLFFDDPKAQQVFRLHNPDVDPAAARRFRRGHAFCCYPDQVGSPPLP